MKPCGNCEKEFPARRSGSRTLCPECDLTHSKCASCNEIKPADQFNANRSRRNGLDGICRTCSISHKLQLRYGITRQEWDRLAAEQNYRCAICKDPERSLHLDHCHVSGKPRALLCSQCNTAIGLLGEEVDLLLRAVDYLELYKAAR